jgi:hypothetical protein
MMVMTLYKHTGFSAAETLALGKLFEAFETSHKRHLVDGSDEDLILSDDGAQLSAVCRSARLCWAYFLCEELASHLKYDVVDRNVDQPVFLVTLVDIKCARPSNRFRVDLRPIVRRLQKGLRDCNYVGVIEPGLYSHITIPGTNLNRSKCISWHLHALVWGISRKEATHLAAKLNRSAKYVPIAPGQTGVDQRQVRDGEFAPALAYLLKRPKYAYRLGLRRDLVASGELSHIQYRDPLRPGEHLTLYLQMKHLSLPNTWVAGGDARQILANVKRHCWTAIRRHERDGSARFRRRPFFQGRQ